MLVLALYILSLGQLQICMQMRTSKDLCRRREIGHHPGEVQVGVFTHTLHQNMVQAGLSR